MTNICLETQQTTEHKHGDDTMIWDRVNSEPITVEQSILVERNGKIGEVSVIRDKGRITFGKTVYEKTNQLNEFDMPIFRTLDNDAEIVN